MIDIEEVENLSVEDVDPRDYPDFCDAYFSEGWHIAENRELTEDELIQLGEDYPEVLNEMAYESLI
jgi:hypothetical protein